MSLEAVGIVSKNIQKTIKFYGLFGVSLQEAGGAEHYEGESGSVRIMVDSVELIKKINPAWQPPSGSSGLVLCFKCDSPAEVDKLYEKVIDSGFKELKSPWDAFWGQRYASLVDPDGNQVDIFAQL